MLTDLTFRVDNDGGVALYPVRTGRPGQRALEALHEVQQTPRHDGVVVQRHVERHHGRRDPDTRQVRRHLVPRPDGAFPQSLPYCEFQEKERDAFDR